MGSAGFRHAVELIQRNVETHEEVEGLSRDGSSPGEAVAAAIKTESKADFLEDQGGGDGPSKRLRIAAEEKKIIQSLTNDYAFTYFGRN
jgi:hypothetical protein